MYYTNCNQIHLILERDVDVPVKSLGEVRQEDWLMMHMYIFDPLSEERPLDTYRVGNEDNAMTFKTLWERRPDWGGIILEMMTTSCSVHLCDGKEWYEIHFCKMNEGLDFFLFVAEKTPIIDGTQNCIISSEDHLSANMIDNLETMMEPVRFGRSLIQRLREVGSNDIEFTVGGYRDLCYKLERIVSNALHQSELWRDRFFFRMINVEEDELCSDCKEDMRKTLYEHSDGVKALKWRPGRGCGGVCKTDRSFFEELEDIHDYL